MPARSVCLVTLSLSEAGPGRFGRPMSVTDIYRTMPYHHANLPITISNATSLVLTFFFEPSTHKSAFFFAWALFRNI